LEGLKGEKGNFEEMIAELWVIKLAKEKKTVKIKIVTNDTIQHL